MTRHWPLQALLDASGLTMHGLAAKTGGDPYSHAETGLSDVQADRWAIRCGLMPHEAWDDWFDAGLTELDREHVENGWRPAWLWNEQHRAPVVELDVAAADELEEAA